MTNFCFYLSPSSHEKDIYTTATDLSFKDKLKSAIEKVSLNDYSVTVEAETSPALGFGYRLGFLGLLHLEVFSQRLEDEYDAEVLITTPSVPFKVILGSTNKQILQSSRP